MMFLIYFLIFLFGLAVGSFLNCLIYRLKTGNSFLRGRSYCPYCKHTLALEDLIPIFSFLILRGKCRYCQNPISWQYPLVELSTAIIFLSTFQLTINNQQLAIPPIFNFCYLLIVACFLIIIFVYDLKHYIIPDKIIYPAITIAFLYRLFTILNLPAPLEAEGFLMGGFGILPSVFFLAIIIFSRGKWMGLGDFKLAFFMSLFLGWPKILVALFSAFLIGAIIGLGLVLSGKKRLQSEVPFGPFLITGTFISLFWGQNIINWYLNFLII